MLQAELLIPSQRLAQSMIEMREWLDHRKVQPSLFEIRSPGRLEEATLVRVGFSDGDIAAAFAECFGGAARVTAATMSLRAAQAC